MFENNKIVIGQKFTPIVEKFNEKRPTEEVFVNGGKATVEKIVDGKLFYEFLLEFSDGDWVSGTKTMPVGEWFDWYKPEEMKVDRKCKALDTKTTYLVKSFDFESRSVKLGCLTSSGEFDWDFNYPFELVVGRFGLVVPEAVEPILPVDSGLSEEKLLRAGEWLSMDSADVRRMIKLAKDLA